MTFTHEFTLAEHYLLTDALETRLQRIDRLIHDWSNPTPEADSVAEALVAEYKAERIAVADMLMRIDGVIRHMSNNALKQSAL